MCISRVSTVLLFIIQDLCARVCHDMCEREPERERESVVLDQHGTWSERWVLIIQAFCIVFVCAWQRVVLEEHRRCIERWLLVTAPQSTSFRICVCVKERQKIQAKKDWVHRLYSISSSQTVIKGLSSQVVLKIRLFFKNSNAVEACHSQEPL